MGFSELIKYEKGVSNVSPSSISNFSLPNKYMVMGGFTEEANMNPEMGHQILGNQSKNPWWVQQLGSRGSKGPKDGNNGVSGCDRKEEITVDSDEEDEGRSYGGVGGKNGHTKLCARGHWRPVEDAKLKELVAQFGPQNWNLIAENLEGRSGKSCRLRWYNQLDPRINRRGFSEEEEERLMAAHSIYGNKWAMISRLFHGRTDNAVKNHWHVIMARKHRQQSSHFCRKRKPTTPLITLTSSSSSSSTIDESKIIPTKALDESVNNGGGCSESTTISSTIDESVNKGVSTYTHISLTPSSSAKPPITTKLFSRFMPPVGKEVEKQVKMGKVDKEKQISSGNVLLYQMGLDQSSGHSDSNSESSVTDSVGPSLFGDNGNNKEERKINVPYFDFLGVGAT